MPLIKFASRRQRNLDYKGLERRRYVRLVFDKPLRFKIINPIFVAELQIGKSQNISETGMLFKTVTPPPRKSFIAIDTDHQAVKDFLRTDRGLVTIDHKILGKVMRTHLNLNNGLFEVGIRFIRPEEKHDQEIKTVLKQL